MIRASDRETNGTAQWGYEEPPKVCNSCRVNSDRAKKDPCCAVFATIRQPALVLLTGGDADCGACAQPLAKTIKHVVAKERIEVGIGETSGTLSKKLAETPPNRVRRVPCSESFELRYCV